MWLIWGACVCAVVAGGASVLRGAAEHAPAPVDAVKGEVFRPSPGSEGVGASAMACAAAFNGRAGLRDEPDRSRRHLDTVPIPAGSYQPFYKGGGDTKSVPVKAFVLDVFPVTRDDYLNFVRRNPAWRKSLVKPLFAEDDYLTDWPGDLDPGIHPRPSPVTFVSWFAAKAYCECQGKRLPSMIEWERVAGGNPGSPANGAAGPLSDEEGPDLAGRSPFRFAMGRAAPDLGPRLPAFASIWEWISDFNSVPATSKSANDQDPLSSLFCGDGFRSTRARDYGAFLRYSFRSSLKANYTLKNLGFRCAKDL